MTLRDRVILESQQAVQRKGGDTQIADDHEHDHLGLEVSGGSSQQNRKARRKAGYEEGGSPHCISVSGTSAFLLGSRSKVEHHCQAAQILDLLEKLLREP
jgi:hypothetical protein